MKYALILIICAVSTICLSAQSGKVKIPDAVKASVAQNYPKAKVTEWEVEDGLYEASLKHNGIATSVLMSSNGRIVLTETEISVDMLPQTALSYLTSKGLSITSAEKHVDAVGKITYEVEAQTDDYHFDQNGNFMRLEPSDDHEEDK